MSQLIGAFEKKIDQESSTSNEDDQVNTFYDIQYGEKIFVVKTRAELELKLKDIVEEELTGTEFDYKALNEFLNGKSDRFEDKQRNLDIISKMAHQAIHRILKTKIENSWVDGLDGIIPVEPRPFAIMLQAEIGSDIPQFIYLMSVPVKNTLPCLKFVNIMECGKNDLVYMSIMELEKNFEEVENKLYELDTRSIEDHFLKNSSSIGISWYINKNGVLFIFLYNEINNEKNYYHLFYHNKSNHFSLNSNSLCFEPLKDTEPITQIVNN